MVIPIPLLNWVFDLTTLSFILFFLLVSLFSLALIFHFRLKTRNSHYLKDFNSLWTVRILLVSFISLWALTELLRLPLLRRHPFPLFPSLTLTQQANLCKLHVVLSLGLFEPGFLATLLFLVNVSVRKRNPNDTLGTAILIVFSSCLPLLVLQVLFVFLSPKEGRLPKSFGRSFVVLKDGFSGATVFCAYPLLSAVAFGCFGVVYGLCFSLSCWRVVALVINKGLRVRIYALAAAVLLALPTQILFLGISVLWRPDHEVFQGLALVVFLSVLSCAVVGEGILVIRPIGDALAAGRGFRRWRCEERMQDRVEVGEKRVVGE